MIKYFPKAILYLIAFILLPVFLGAAPTPEEGKKLFVSKQCASCHDKKMKADLTGPALAGAIERWADYPESDLYAWIRNSQALVKAGHPRAVELFNQYNKVVMTAANDITDDEIGSILAYIRCTTDGNCPGGLPVVDAGGAAASVGESGTPTWLYYALFGLLAFLAILLARIISNLNLVAAKQEGVDYERKTLMQTLTGKGVIGFALFAAIILGGYTTVNNAINLGRQQGYAPVQPIKFSHETHAGTHKIDCQYCHDGARRSKHSVIPAANTCMNCHSAIKVGSVDGTAELTKIYASIGFDPLENKYIDDYTDKSQEEVKAIYQNWIATNYMKTNALEELDNEGERIVEEQWDGIVSSLTNEQKKTVQGPIEWIRIHNLPDHVYFNHAQHVTIGKVECQQCHGKVEEMGKLQQHSPLSMGWCINCHRETEVKFADNDYYKSYVKYHEQIGSGERTGVTVEDIGGLECQKCHY